MKNAMSKRTFNHIVRYLHELNLDLENGEILNRKVKSTTPQGYVMVGIGGGKVAKHQILAVALFGEACLGKTIDHIDRDKENNRADNLRVVTDDENNSLKGEKGVKRPRRKIKATNVETGEIKIFKTQRDACRILGVIQKSVWLVLEGKMNTTGGYKFERVEN